METTLLGRTGLRVSRMGLGCGGHSRLGLGRGGSLENAVRIVRNAIDLGVNFIDTAETYGTEDAVGQAVVDLSRESVVLSTKVGATFEERPATAAETRARVEGCLRRLRTDYVDVLHLHGILPEEYAHATDVLFPELARMQTQGKIRHVGITEAFIRDPGHRMLTKAVREGPWEVAMVGFNLLNPSARERVFPMAQARGIGTLCMFAVRRALSQPDALRSLLNELAVLGKIDLATDLGFLGPDLRDAAYRFCRWEPGVDVVLSGTGSCRHLRENVESLQGPALPIDHQRRVRDIFEKVDTVSGN